MKHFKSPRKMSAESEALSDGLKKMRELYGETQVQFAARFKISEFTYLRWEKYGPPRTMAHREYVRIMLERLGKDVAKKAKATSAKNARVVPAAD